MAFVNEKIPAAEIEKFGVVDTAPDGTKTVLSSKWTIDRERGAVIAYKSKVGGPYEGTQVTEYYTLHWEGEQISIAADPGPTTFPAEGSVMTWRIHDLRIPASLQDRTPEIQQLVRDAFVAKGDGYSGEQFAAVHVEFDLSSSR